MSVNQPRRRSPPNLTQTTSTKSPLSHKYLAIFQHTRKRTAHKPRIDGNCSFCSSRPSPTTHAPPPANKSEEFIFCFVFDQVSELDTIGLNRETRDRVEIFGKFKKTPPKSRKFSRTHATHPLISKFHFINVKETSFGYEYKTAQNRTKEM